MLDVQVKTITALTVAALAEAAAPYGIESFDDVLEPLWKGIRLLRGKVLAAFLKVRVASEHSTTYHGPGSSPFTQCDGACSRRKLQT